MSQSATLSTAGRQDNGPPEPLEKGAHLSAAEFLRRGLQSPEHAAFQDEALVHPKGTD